MTPVAAKVAWYSPYMRWSIVGDSGSSVGEGKIWVVGWVCGRVFCGYVFVKGVLLGYLDGIFLGLINGCELRTPNGVSLGDFE